MQKSSLNILAESMQKQVQVYRDELKEELRNILVYWQKNAVDDNNGGFYGKITTENEVVANAPKGGVLNSRILWTFAAAYNQTRNAEWLGVAERAYKYLNTSFRDREHGGIYWLVDYTGKVLDGKKQIYGLSFAMYGLSEYYKATRQQEVLDFAIELFELIEKHSFDPEAGGYFEAFAQDWQALDDLRLSAKDANEKKTMNTHLHVLEAYTNLYRVWKNERLAKQIRHLLDVFKKYMIDSATHHLHLFLDQDWTVKSNILSYGHDIEASWLLLESAEVLNDESLIEEFKGIAIYMANAAAEGLEDAGALNYEKEGDHYIREKHWWVQAEAMVGFFNAWQINRDEAFLNKSLHTWEFVKQSILDKTQGEWFWGITADNEVMASEDKVGFWKCPYHNARACLELISRIAKEQVLSRNTIHQ